MIMVFKEQHQHGSQSYDIRTMWWVSFNDGPNIIDYTVLGTTPALRYLELRSISHKLQITSRLIETGGVAPFWLLERMHFQAFTQWLYFLVPEAVSTIYYEVYG